MFMTQGVGIKTPVLTDALLSTYDLASGVVYAGYLERKSGFGLIWKKNYAVLICINGDVNDKTDKKDTGNKNIRDDNENHTNKNERKSFLLCFYSKHVSTVYGDVGVGAEVCVYMNMYIYV
jgi:hypothetical protein